MGSVELKRTSQEERTAVWMMAKGLQAVDGLSTSSFLDEAAERHVAGELSVEDAVRSVVERRGKRCDDGQDRTREADIVAARIVKVLLTRSFPFWPAVLKRIHRELFEGVDPLYRAGEHRTVNLSKREPVLGGDSVVYADWRSIGGLLEHDFRTFAAEKADYREEAALKRLARFISGIWQAHPFMEGNTRTVAVLCLTMLRSKGVEVDPAPFAESSRLFRDALVLSNRASVQDGIEPDFVPLDRFFERLVLREGLELREEGLRGRSRG